MIRNKIWSLSARIAAIHDAWAGWLCVFIVGIFAGITAGIIDIGAEWMKDLKYGICPGAFYLNREQCCWNADAFLEGKDEHPKETTF